MNPRDRLADNDGMCAWFSKVVDSVASKIDSRGPVREALQAALRERCRVYLEVPAQNIVALTQVEQITDDEIVIAVPSIGGMTYPLAFGEALKVSFVDQKVNRTGATKCLGRVKVAGGGGKTLMAYRLAMPDTLTVEERRTEPRTELAPDVAPEGHLYSGKMPTPITGRITNVSIGGARLTVAAQPPRSIVAGQEMYLKFQLPDPVGVVDEIVEIRRIEFDRKANVHHIGMAFHARVDRLATLMRSNAAPASGPNATTAHNPPMRKSA